MWKKKHSRKNFYYAKKLPILFDCFKYNFYEHCGEQVTNSKEKKLKLSPTFLVVEHFLVEDCYSSLDQQFRERAI